MKNRKAHIPLPGQYLPNLYLNIAHGSRGLTSAPVTAALISALIQKQPLPLDRELTKALNPARMLIRDMIKNG
jgi:tRNA 5-methylaminomethyl-2-thiouridine biosynthesis bifunctional protein